MTIRMKHTKEFKEGAVRLAKEPGMTVKKAAQDLGISHYVLKNWIYAKVKHEEEAFPGHGNLRPEDLKIKELEKKLRRAEMERDILKKAVTYFAELDKRNSGS